MKEFQRLESMEKVHYHFAIPDSDSATYPVRMHKGIHCAYVYGLGIYIKAFSCS